MCRIAVHLTETSMQVKQLVLQTDIHPQPVHLNRNYNTNHDKFDNNVDTRDNFWRNKNKNNNSNNYNITKNNNNTNNTSNKSELSQAGGGYGDYGDNTCGVNKYRATLVNILQRWDKIARDNNITYFLTYGSLLGSWRDGDQIPYDTDMDVYVMSSENEKINGLKDDRTFR